ncbi:hypothetical protein [Variovorax sp. E3]|uniref:hypothetical protein n=1 Tax=Variovorax sp. E3 TaxID=1914993 RepID=UPI0022B6E6C7|nr:hypothetical protein [Variovorax sp. E3]
MQALQLRPDSTQAQSNLALYLEVTGQREQADRLMEVNRMPAAARTAVREAAQQMRGGSTTPPLAATPAAPVALAVRPLSGSLQPARDDTAPPPLMLKASRWAGMGGVRTASQLNPSTADAALSPNSTSQGPQ